jgi:ureidoglycolate lyase
VSVRGPHRIVQARPLTREAFAPFGDVIETAQRPWRSINRGTAERYDELARLDLVETGGQPLLSIYRANAQTLPLIVHSLERHPLSSQAFYPLEARPFLIVVAEAGAETAAETAAQPDTLAMGRRVRAFISSGRQGINYRRNTWHHALIALEQRSDFLVLERGGPEPNCEEIGLAHEAIQIHVAADGASISSSE